MKEQPRTSIPHFQNISFKQRMKKGHFIMLCQKNTTENQNEAKEQ